LVGAVEEDFQFFLIGNDFVEEGLTWKFLVLGWDFVEEGSAWRVICFCFVKQRGAVGGLASDPEFVQSLLGRASRLARYRAFQTAWAGPPATRPARQDFAANGLRCESEPHAPFLKIKIKVVPMQKHAQRRSRLRGKLPWPQYRIETNRPSKAGPEEEGT
jgi:hypothetical protein